MQGLFCVSGMLFGLGARPLQTCKAILVCAYILLVFVVGFNSACPEFPASASEPRGYGRVVVFWRLGSKAVCLMRAAAVLSESEDTEVQTVQKIFHLLSADCSDSLGVCWS